MLLIDIRAECSYEPDCLRVPRKVNFVNYIKLANEASHPRENELNLQLSLF